MWIVRKVADNVQGVVIFGGIMAYILWVIRHSQERIAR